METKAIIEILKGTLKLPLTDSQKILLIKQLIDGLEFRLSK